MKSYKTVEMIIVLFQEDIVTASTVEKPNEYDDVIQDFFT